MTVASALVSGNEPLPYLAEQAVAEALAKAGLTHANGVLLFLSPEFARHAQHTVTAVARAAQCTQVAGGIASGVFTENGWAVDRPSIAVMVFGGGLSLGHGDVPDAPVLSYAGTTFPPEWGSACPPRFGGSFSGNPGVAEAVVWQQSRLSEQQRCSVQVLGAHVAIGVSSGLQLLGDAQPVERSTGYDLERIADQNALQNLAQHLPAELRKALPQHVHRLSAVLIDGEGHAEAALAEGRYRALALIAANPDHSLTLAEHVAPGQLLAWAIRQPDAAEADMRQSIERLARSTTSPVCALMFSCIGRGPYFYGGDDRDLNALRQRFPGLPVLGAYGTGQIAPMTAATSSCNRPLQNAVITALVSPFSQEAHVQSIP